MEEKLRSISKQIHWSSLLKAGIFALAWLLLPWWLFVLLALAAYLVPLFHAGKLALPFFVLLVISYLQAPTPLSALVFGAAFYFLLLIKNLLLIDRGAARELLASVLSFILLRDFYIRFNEGIGGAAFFFSFCTALLIALLVRNYARASGELSGQSSRIERIGIWLSCLLIWQLMIAGLFLPVDFTYQTVIVFLPTILILDLLPDHLSGKLSRAKLLGSSIMVFVLFVIVMVSANWGF